jgi:hypothetical protein
VTGKAEAGGDRAAAILAPIDLDADAEREACIVLAGVPLAVCGGDPEAAKGPLAEVLTAIGAIPYQPGASLNLWGQRRNEKEASQ